MPSPTYVALAKTVLTGSQATVTLSSIPSTYTDLILKCYVRSTNASTTDNLFLQVNSLTGVYSSVYLRGSGAAVSTSTRPDFQLGLINGATSTSNTFSYVEFYFPNYTASQHKAVSLSMAQENNLTTAWINEYASLVRSTDVISSLTLTAGNFDTGSRFDLYGIKNS